MKTWIIIAALMIVTITYSVIVMFHMLIFRDPEVFYRYARSWSRMLLRLSSVHVKVEGAERIQAGSRYVYAANHSSLFDIPILLAHIPDNVRIMYKAELGKVPVWGWALRMSPFIAVDRNRSRQASGVLENVVESMKSGASVMIFPEGTRSSDGTLGPFRRGAVSIAVRSNTPILPVTICGSEKILPARSKRINGGNVKIVVEAPIQVSAVDGPEGEKELVSKLRAVIEHRVNLCS